MRDGDDGDDDDDDDDDGKDVMNSRWSHLISLKITMTFVIHKIYINGIMWL